MRVGDLQQIMMQIDAVGKIQQAGAHGAEVEQGKLAARQQEEKKVKEKQVQSLAESDTVEIHEREARQQRQENEAGEAEGDAEERADEAETADDLKAPGKVTRHIDIVV
ncbi:MAG: hypothetical protein GXO34_02515 [Deltaproteobacteria bacterium]|nr:hypothetical protein [Deltaproteobacteria bacterium]